MARVQFAATLGTSNAYGVPNSVSIKPAGDPAAASSTLTTDTASMTAAAVTVAAAVATLVSDGASPTQAHVNALNTAYTTLATAMTTVAADAVVVAAATGGDVACSFNTATVTSYDKLKKALDDILLRVRGSKYVTQ